MNRSRPAKHVAAPRAVASRMRTSKRADRPHPAAPLNLLNRLPSEILIRILSYLDAAALFSIIHVSRLFCQLANDEALWNKIYMVEVSRNTKRNPECVDKQRLRTATLQLPDRAAGHWRRLYFRALASHGMNTWRSHLGPISRHTGMPSRTEPVLRNLQVTWELTVSDRSGRQSSHEPSCSEFCETSVTLSWSGGGRLPDYQHISTLQLHGVRRIALNCPGLKKPGWRSLMASVDVPALTEGARVIGRDSLVELRLLQPGVVIGVWRDRSSVAFVMLTLHFHRLVERSIQGSSVRPYVEPIMKSPFDDIDPEYGLHGYRLHIVLHNTACEIMSGSFPPMFCRRTQICDGLLQLTAISRTVMSQHTPLSSSTSLPWSCEALQGAVKNCCIMSLTLLDEFQKPFWCVCSPVSMEIEKTSVSYDYDGEHFSIHHRDPDGQVKMNLVWMEDQKQLLLISLVVYVTVCKVNQHFSRNY